MANYASRGKFFEEFRVGDTLVSAGRTITESDIVNFAGLTGDYTQIHTNAEFARASFFGQRVAHGPLVLSIAGGLMVQQGFIEGTILAFRELSWKFSQPVFIGDTIHVEGIITETKAVPRLGGGLVIIEVQVINQANQRVQIGRWTVLVASQPVKE